MLKVETVSNENSASVDAIRSYLPARAGEGADQENAHG